MTNCLPNLINDNIPKSTIKRKRQQSNEATLNHYSGSLYCINSKVLGEVYFRVGSRVMIFRCNMPIGAAR